jgi:hypothetical protein
MPRRRPTRFAAQALLPALLLLAAPAPTRAQDLVLTAPSASALIDDLRYLLSAASANDQIKPALDALDQLKAPGALKGLDGSKPIGAFASLPKGPNDPPSAAIFIPVTDAKTFLDTLKGFGLGVEANASFPGFTHKITVADTGVDLYALASGGYLYLTPVPGGPDALRAMKPAALLPKRPGAGDLSLTGRIDRIPAAIKDRIIEQMDQNLAQTRRRQAGEADVEYQSRMAGMKITQEAFVSVLREGRSFDLDLIVDPKRQELALELGIGASPGTQLATTLRSFGSRQSLFRGLAKGSALSAWASVPMAQPLRDAMRLVIDQARKEARKGGDEAARKLADQFFDAIEPSLTADELDLGMGIYGPFPRPGKEPVFVALFGMKARQGRRIDQLIRQAAKQAKPDDSFQATFDVARASDGVTPIHKIKGDPKDFPSEQFGDSLLFFACRDDLALVAVGENGLTAIQQALDATLRPPTGPSAPIEGYAAISRLAQLDQPDRAKALDASRQAFKGADASKDAIRLNLRGEGDALRLRLSADVPTLRFFAVLGQKP